LLLHTLMADESEASARMRQAGVTESKLARCADRAAGTAVRSETEVQRRSAAPEVEPDPLNDPVAFRAIQDRARMITRRRVGDAESTTCDLLQAVIELSPEVREQLAAQGVDVALLAGAEPPTTADTGDGTDESASLQWLQSWSAAVIDDPAEERPDTGRPIVIRDSHSAVLRAVDASLNRAREGLRVLEDCARFTADDAGLWERLKSLRHAVSRLPELLPDNAALALQSLARDTPGDVGTGDTVASEYERAGITDLVLSNSRRAQEALRSVEEFGKLLSPDLAARAKALRYECYDVEAALLRVVSVSGWRRQRLAASVICVLVTEADCRHPWQRVVEDCLRGGADIIQLREKSLPDGELCERAGFVAGLCRSAGALSIINDRADICVAADADGVHVGQTELPATGVRRVIGPDRLLGVSTHDLPQLMRATDDGADYVGVGPVFRSATKSFDSLAGVDFVELAAVTQNLPWFAIGGIDQDRLPALRAAGAARIAVSAAVIRSADPAAAVRELRQLLDAGAG
jgi:thiamine-phosphate pyrophosphorylase